MDTPNPITHPDRIQHIDTPDDSPKDRVDAVQVRLRGMRDEVLAAAGVGTGERHADGAHVVPHRIDFVAEHEPRPRSTPSVTPRIAVLYDEVRHDAMPAHAVEEAPLDEAQECGHGDRGLGGQELDVEPATVGLQNDVRVRTAERGREPAT